MRSEGSSLRLLPNAALYDKLTPTTRSSQPVTTVDPWRTGHTYIPPSDDRDWKTESSAQYIKKDGKMAKVRLNEERRQLVTLAP